MMINRKTKIVLIAAMFVFGGLFVSVETSHALFQEINDQNQALAGEEGAAFTITDDPRLVAMRLVRVAVSLLGVGFFFYTLYGGTLIAFSQGKEDDIKKGKSTIMTGVIGVLIMLMSYGITQFVSDAVLRAVQKDACSEQGGEACFYALPDSGVSDDPLAPPRDDGSRAESFWRSIF